MDEREARLALDEIKQYAENCMAAGALMLADRVLSKAERGIAALSKPEPVAQQGMVLVPKEPTEEMLVAAFSAPIGGDSSYQDVGHYMRPVSCNEQYSRLKEVLGIAYKAMLAAAPTTAPSTAPLKVDQVDGEKK